MKLVELEEMSREEKIRTMSLIWRVLVAADMYDRESSQPLRNNVTLVNTRTELHDALEAWRNVDKAKDPK